MVGFTHDTGGFTYDSTGFTDYFTRDFTDISLVVLLMISLTDSQSISLVVF